MKHSGYHDDKITGRIDIQDNTNIKNAGGTTNKLRSIIDYTGAILDDKIDTGGITDDRCLNFKKKLQYQLHLEHFETLFCLLF